MKHNALTYQTGFGEYSFRLECTTEDALFIAEFLFLDFPGAKSGTPIKQFDIVSSGQAPMLSLWDGDKRLYFGTSRYQLAYILINEVIYHCINPMDSHHALHAGAVYRGDRCILMPGTSGNGKSTLTGWLIKNGYRYLTDELVFLNHSGRVLPMTRPISLKVNSSHESWLLSENHDDKIITSETGSMIPHRLLNPCYEPKEPVVTDIIFPSYNPDAEPGLCKISPAKSSLYLLQSHVNARNLEGHGVPELASIVKNCQSFTLSYSSFEDLQRIFNTDSGLFR